MTKPIRVLIVDDSPTVRHALKGILEQDPLLQVMGMAENPVAAAEQLRREVPDVITLDIEMPRMNGLTFLDRLMAQHPIPVVICSSHSQAGSDVALSALEKGAVDIIAKPRLGTEEALQESAVHICDVVKAAARAKPRRRAAAPAKRRPTAKLTADAMLSLPPNQSMTATETVIVVGASTGGPVALASLLCELPAACPGILIVQHMPERFTASFATRLNEQCELEVQEAKDGDTVRPGLVLIAPGGLHMMLIRRGTRYSVSVKAGPLVSRHRPSVDVLFRSAARYAGTNALGIIMTGMGDDGARGMLEMKTAGAYNIAQDETTSVVFGMPHEAFKLGAVDKVVPLPEIADEVIRYSAR